MAIRINFDSQNNAIEPTLVLATRSGKKLGSIPAVNISVSDALNSPFDLSFTLHKNLTKDAGEGSPRSLVETYGLWDEVEDFRLVWCRDWDVWFEISVELSEGDSTVKNISCKSLGEAELSQIKLYTTEINTEDDIARDDYSPTIIFDESKPEASLLHRIMEKAPHYEVKHVDSSIAHLQRTFTFDNISLLDAFHEIEEEVDCIFIIDSGTAPDGSIERKISVYDLLNYCPKCKHRESSMDVCPECGNKDIIKGYGKDTTILVSSDNLTDNIVYKTDVASVKNCFKLSGGDDLMTATIRNCSPTNDGYLWYVTEKMRKDMSPELKNKLSEYDTKYDYYLNDYILDVPASVRSSYDNLVKKYVQYDKDLKPLSNPIKGYPKLMEAKYQAVDFYLFLHDGLMPSPKMIETTAAKQAALLTTQALSPTAVTDLEKCSLATATNSVLAHAKVLIDSRYRTKAKGESFENGTWRGTFTITSYVDDADTATTPTISVSINDDYEQFVKQKIDKALNNCSISEAVDITELFKLDLPTFKTEIKKYCLVGLTSLYDACRTVLDVLTEQGIADNKTWANSDPNLYQTLYVPYYEKLGALEAESKLREQEITITTGTKDEKGVYGQDGVQGVIDAARRKISDELNLEKYLGTQLWKELQTYRREDEYSNSNYISDGLDNAELFKRALEFIDTAKKEIFKSATLQHTITADLYNLLTIKEFKPIVDYFAVGNWIRVSVDGVVYKLRLISYSVEFDSLSDISVEFSDVVICANGLNDVKSIMDKASSMASSYDSVSKQAGNGDKEAKRVSGWVNDGLDLTTMKVVNSSDNQNITYDSHGLWCKEYLPITDEYDDRQLKIINKGLYLTDDNWRTAKAGIGAFTFFNPKTGKQESSYGVIADKLVGNVILSEEVGIYNDSQSVQIDKDGLCVTANSKTDNTNLIHVRKENEDGTYTDFLQMKPDGELIINSSSIKMQSGGSIDEHIDQQIEQGASSLQMTLTRENIAVIANSDGSGMDFTGCSTTVALLVGTKDITANTNHKWNVISSAGVLGSWDLSTHTYTVLGLNGDNETVRFTATLDDGRSISRVFQVYRVKKGADGVNGDPGENGAKVTTIAMGINTFELYEIQEYLEIGASSSWENITNASVSKGDICVVSGTVDNGTRNWAIYGEVTNYNTISKVASMVTVSSTLDGLAGTSSYLHIAYANSATGDNFDVEERFNPDGSPKKYIGQYTDNIEADSLDWSKYNWSKYIGDDGYTPVKGVDYFDGGKGADGESSYIHIRYSQNPDGSGFVEQPTELTKYMGVATTNSTTPPTLKTDYEWSKYIGEDGVKGESSYIHIAYANSPTGDGFDKDVATGKTYIGTYQDDIKEDSDDPSMYKWALIKGEDGKDAAIVSDEPPTPPELDMLWCNTSVDPPIMERYDGEKWVVVNDQSDLKDEVTTVTRNFSEFTKEQNQINLSVSQGIEGANGQIEELTKKVQASITDSEAKISVLSQKVDSGTGKVSTVENGFTFDDKGLNISKSNSPVSTQITEDGMTVNKDGKAMLTANMNGVDAKNLHATTFLIIGQNSRLEDFVTGTGESRTACFWIGN